jgi:hypothetical protein
MMPSIPHTVKAPAMATIMILVTAVCLIDTRKLPTVTTTADSAVK